MDPEPLLLQKVPIFGGLTVETLRYLLDKADVVQVAAGERFFEQGDHGESLFVLEEGEVEIWRSNGDRRFLLRRLGPGEVFGEMALLAVIPRSATVLAVAPSQAVRITNRHLFALYERDVAQFAMLVMNLGREVCRRLHATDERLFALAPEAARAVEDAVRLAPPTTP